MKRQKKEEKNRAKEEKEAEHEPEKKPEPTPTYREGGSSGSKRECMDEEEPDNLAGLLLEGKRIKIFGQEQKHSSRTGAHV